MSHSFTPPTEDSVPAVYLGRDSYRPVPVLSQRLFRHYPQRTAGVNIYKLVDGSYTTTQPYPYIDASVQPGQPGDTTVLITYLGGHSYEVSDAEAAALTAAGYGANIT